MKLIDTNVFIYAVGREHPYKQACSRLVLDLAEGKLEGNVDTELHQEILNHYWRLRRLQEGFSLFERLLKLCPHPIAITREIVMIACDLLSEYPIIAPRDAVHAAVVMAHDLEGIISTDHGFDAIPQITRFDPKDIA